MDKKNFKQIIKENGIKFMFKSGNKDSIKFEARSLNSISVYATFSGVNNVKVNKETIRLVREGISGYGIKSVSRRNTTIGMILATLASIPVFILLQDSFFIPMVLIVIACSIIPTLLTFKVGFLSRGKLHKDDISKIKTRVSRD